MLVGSWMIDIGWVWMLWCEICMYWSIK